MSNLELEAELSKEFRRIQDKGIVYSSPSYYIHARDSNLGGVIEPSRDHLNRDWGLSTKPMVGMVVGTGGLLSIFPELPIDVWLVCDNNQFVLDWVDKTKDAIRTAPTLDDYLRMLYTENPQASQDYVYAKTGLEQEKISLGNYHLTSDEQRFQRAKQSAKDVSIVRCEGDLANPRFLREAGEILRRRELSISFANLTNVYEFAPGIHTSLPNLPFRDGAVFVWSYRAFGSYLVSQFSDNGIDGYLRYAKGAYTQFIAEEQRRQQRMRRQ